MVRYSRFALPIVLALLATAVCAERFSLCRRGGEGDCVVDGDTFRRGRREDPHCRHRYARTHGPHFEAEWVQGMQATGRLLALLNAGPFSLEAVERDRDRYGRSVGAMLVKKGLARPWTGSRQPWCRS